MNLFERFQDAKDYAVTKVSEISNEYNKSLISKKDAITQLTNLYNEIDMMRRLDSKPDDFQYSLLLLGIKDVITKYEKLK